jgi:fidgetin-like protein 1
MENEKLSIRASKLMMQTKLTSLCSSKFLKADGVPDRNMFKSENLSKECAGIETRTNQNGSRHPAYLEVEEDVKPRGLVQNAKRKHTGFRSPICEVSNSPLSNDEGDAPANEFMTARTKMVCTFVTCNFSCTSIIFYIILMLLFVKYFGQGLLCFSK